MLSKGDVIDWAEVEKELRHYMRRNRGTFNEQTFWHSQGGFECFFTMINGNVFRNSYFDTPVTLAEVQARETPITTKINWDALFVEYGAHISQRPKDMGKALWLAKFWEDRGGEERYFDTGPFGESVRREYLLTLTPPVKINWDSIRDDWTDFWTHRGFAQDQLEGYEEFWKRLGGINRYFDTDDKGFRTQREYLLDVPKHTSEVSKPLSGEDIGKVWDQFRGPEAQVAMPRARKIHAIALDLTKKRQTCNLGQDPKVLFAEVMQSNKNVKLRVETDDADDFHDQPATLFTLFRADDVIRSDPHQKFAISFKGLNNMVYHLYMSTVISAD